MSEKERKKKDGRDKNKKNRASRREPAAQQSSAKTEKNKPAEFGEGLARNDRPETKQ